MEGMRYQLTVQVGPERGKVIPLDQPELVIGRDPTSTIVINDPEVSRKHTRLSLKPAGYFIEDLGSTNGTVVNGNRLSAPRLLKNEDEISLGEQVILVFEVIPVDPLATQKSTSWMTGKPQVVTPPVAEEQPPVEQNPTEPQSFSGQVPLGPVPEEPLKKRFPVWAIIVIAVVLVIICLCVATLYFIDANRLWCTVFPFLSGCP